MTEKSKAPKKKREVTETEKIQKEEGLEEVAEVALEEIAVIDETATPEVIKEVIKPVAPIQIASPSGWVPKTKLGKMVLEGKVTSIDEIFEKGMKITESQIVDVLLPNLQSEIILVGGSGGKGGGIKRIPSRRTTRMHKSGRRFKTSAMVVVGNGNGYVGVGMGGGPAGKHREVINKATNHAKLNIIPIRRGCGSWECNCGSPHSLPIKTIGRCGSVYIELLPAPKGIGLCVNNESKKVMRLAGIKDIWCKSRGQTATRFNTIKAIIDAFDKLNKFRSRPEYETVTGLKTGMVE